MLVRTSSSTNQLFFRSFFSISSLCVPVYSLCITGMLAHLLPKGPRAGVVLGVSLLLHVRKCEDQCNFSCLVPSIVCSDRQIHAAMFFFSIVPLIPSHCLFLCIIFFLKVIDRLEDDLENNPVKLFRVCIVTLGLTTISTRIPPLFSLVAMVGDLIQGNLKSLVTCRMPYSRDFDSRFARPLILSHTNSSQRFVHIQHQLVFTQV